MSDLFRQFLSALKLSVRQSEIENISDNVHWKLRKNITNLYARNDIFKKRIPNMRF